MTLSPFSDPVADMSWFATTKHNFAQYLPLLPRPFSALQIGVFRGDASLWLVETFPDIQLTDVDPWEGIDLIPNPVESFTIDYRIAETIYDSRMDGWGVRKMKMTSREFFAQNGQLFDFIYIDGDHHAIQALEDCVNAHRYLNVGGILAFDDYTNACYDLQPGEQPYLAFDAFCMVFAPYYGALSDSEGSGSSKQVWLKRVA